VHGTNLDSEQRHEKKDKTHSIEQEESLMENATFTKTSTLTLLNNSLKIHDTRGTVMTHEEVIKNDRRLKEEQRSLIYCFTHSHGRNSVRFRGQYN
jgi:alpha-L-fucosidase